MIRQGEVYWFRQLECQILVDGSVKAEARTTGGFASPAQCSAF